MVAARDSRLPLLAAAETEMPALTYAYGATIGIGGIFAYLSRCFSRPAASPREHLCVERFRATFQSEELTVLQEKELLDFMSRFLHKLSASVFGWDAPSKNLRSGGGPVSGSSGSSYWRNIEVNGVPCVADRWRVCG